MGLLQKCSGKFESKNHHELLYLGDTNLLHHDSKLLTRENSQLTCHATLSSGLFCVYSQILRGFKKELVTHKGSQVFGTGRKWCFLSKKKSIS